MRHKKIRFAEKNRRPSNAIRLAGTYRTVFVHRTTVAAAWRLVVRPGRRQHPLHAALPLALHRRTARRLYLTGALLPLPCKTSVSKQPKTGQSIADDMLPRVCKLCRQPAWDRGGALARPPRSERGLARARRRGAVLGRERTTAGAGPRRLLKFFEIYDSRAGRSGR